ncbi:MAG: lysophospholipase [Pirellulales bacterium]|nr:lysophospholipase [Pirellulales bacterium]
MPYSQETVSGRSGLKLFLQRWLPAGAVRAAVALVHGVNEHGGRYGRLAEELNGRGIAVHAIDLRGFGRSEGERGLVLGFDEFLDDVELLLAQTAAAHPGKPLFLLGHSMGGEIATWLTIERQPRIDGLILSAPALLVGGNVFPILRHLAAFFSRVLPRLRLRRMGTRFMSRDPQVIEDFKNDPLVYHGKFAVRTGAEILRTVKLIRRRMEDVRVPLLVMHGTRDLVTDPNGSRQLYARASSADKTLRLYPGLYHEIFNEPEREQVIGDLIAWIEQRS